MNEHLEDVRYLHEHHRDDDLAAARKRLELEHTLRSAPDSPGAQDAQDALDELDERFPRAHEEMLAATHAELYGGGSAPHGHARLRQELRREHGVSAAHAARMRAERPAGSPASGRRVPSAGGAVRAGAAGSRRAYRSRPSRALGVTALGGGITDTALAMTRIGLGLALLYFVLNARGSKALSTILGTSGGLLRAFLAPVDPLKPGTLDTVSAAAGGSHHRTFGTAQRPTVSGDLPHGAPAHVTGSRAAHAARRNSHPITP
jgi:hypothetical protein